MEIINLNSQIQNNRSSNFELLRIVAMFMIVACHYCAHGIRHLLTPELSSIWLDGIQANRLFTSFLINGGDIGNGIFFLLTGYFMFGKEYKIRRLVKLLGQVYFYAFFIILIFFVLRAFNIYKFSEFSSMSKLMLIINAIIPITSGSWWFIQTYIILFLFIPVINGFLEKLNSKSFIAVLCLIWVFWLLPKTIGFWYSNLQMAIFFYILGAGLKKSNLKINKFVYLISFCIIWGLLSLIDITSSHLIDNTTMNNKILKMFYTAASMTILTPLAVVCLFEFFKNLNMKNHKLINIIASTTFGIYLIHDSSIGRTLIWTKIFHCLDYQYNSVYFPLFAILTASLVFISCSIIDYLRQLFIEKRIISFMNKIIDSFTKEK